MASAWVVLVTILGMGPHTFALSLAETEYTRQPAKKYSISINKGLKV